VAYAATVTVDRYTQAGRRYVKVTVTETEAATASEWSTSGANPSYGSGYAKVQIPAAGRIVSRKVNITAGTATQVAPVLGRVTGITAAGVNSIAVEAAANLVNSVAEIPFALVGGVLFGRSQVQGGSSDNSVTTEIVIAEGAA
jgi:hypothetical protein